VIAVEVKLSPTVDDHDVRQLLWLGERLGDDLLDAMVITTGRSAYRRPDGVAIVPPPCWVRSRGPTTCAAPGRPAPGWRAAT